MLTELVLKLLNEREFISAATCNLEGQPNAAPKFLLKCDKNYIYLVDYTIGKTWENLKINPRISLSFSDAETLKGYKINGSVQIIAEGANYKDLLKEFRKRLTLLSVDRIVEAVRHQKKQKHFGTQITEHFVIFKVKISEITEIRPEGDLERETL